MNVLKIVALLTLFAANNCFAQINQDSVQELVWRKYSLNDSTITIAKRMIVRKPYEPYLHFVLAEALLNNEKDEEAHSEFIKALDYSSRSKLNVTQIEEIGNKLRFKFQDYKRANQAADSVLVINPIHKGALEIKGHSLLRLGIYDSSIKIYEILLSNARQVTNWEKYIAGTYLNYIGEAYEEKQEYSKAIQYYTDAIQNNNNDGFIYKSRGKCKAELADYRGALTDFDMTLNKSEKHDITYYSALNDKIYAKMMLKRYAEVIVDATAVISSAKEKSIRAYAYYMRGGAKHELKNTAGACIDWSKAGELGEDGVYDLIKKLCN